MTKVVGVRFRNVGKIYYFSPKDYEIKTGDHAGSILGKNMVVKIYKSNYVTVHAVLSDVF